MLAELCMGSASRASWTSDSIIQCFTIERHYDVQANTRSGFNHLAWSQSTDLLLQFLSQFVEGGSLAGVLLPAGPHQGINSRGAVFWSLHAITCLHSLLHLPERLQEQKEQIAEELWGRADWNFTTRRTQRSVLRVKTSSRGDISTAETSICASDADVGCFIWQLTLWILISYIQTKSMLLCMHIMLYIRLFKILHIGPFNKNLNVDTLLLFVLLSSWGLS